MLTSTDAMCTALYSFVLDVCCSLRALLEVILNFYVLVIQVFKYTYLKSVGHRNCERSTEVQIFSILLSRVLEILIIIKNITI